MKRLALLLGAVSLFGCVHQVNGVLGSHEARIWVVRTNYRGVQEIYRCVDEGAKATCIHAPLED